MTTISAEFAAAWIKALASMPDLYADNKVDVKTRGDGRNYSYKYADLAQVLKIGRDVLHENGLALHQTVSTGPTVHTFITYKSGEQMEAGALTIASTGAQQIGSAITYARRYSATAVLGLAVEDDDGKAASHQGNVEPDEGLIRCPSGGYVREPENAKEWANLVKAEALLFELDGRTLGDLDESDHSAALENAVMYYAEALEVDAPADEYPKDVARPALETIAQWWADRRQDSLAEDAMSQGYQ